MNSRLKRGLAALAATAAIATTAPILAASPAAAATDKGAATVNPSSGTRNTTFTLGVQEAGGTTGQCPGDGNDGWRWSTFIIPAAADIDATLSFTGTGAVDPVAGEYRQNLYRAQASPSAVRNNGVDIGANTITGIPGMSFQSAPFDSIPSGAYNVGIACHGGPSGEGLASFWAQTVTLDNDGSNITWVQGAQASAPANVVATGQDSALSVSFDAVTADPAVTGYTATVYEQGTTNLVASATGASSPITVAGLVNGTTYDVTVAAANGVGAPAESAPVSGTPGVSNTAPTVTATPGFGESVVTWTPAGGSPTGYEVTVSPDPTTGPYSVVVPVADPREVTITGLDPAVLYTVSVQALYADAGVTAPAGTDQVQVIDNSAIVQTIQGERPAGEFVLSQDCPTIDCLVVLDAAVLDADAEYYSATGELHPISVLDTRDTDNGWTVNANIADEFESTGDAFSAEALGFEPVVLDDSAPLGDGYDQVVTPGATIAPWSSTDLVDGTAVLMDSRPVTGTTGGLGLATATAQLDLQIPVTASAGTYTAVISFTAA